MRSRFSAFAKRAVEYLIETLHPSNEDQRRPRAELVRELQTSVNEYRYMGLTVLETAAPDAEGVARVLFVARVFEKGKDRSFVELSEFLCEEGAWKYLAGEGLPLALLKVAPSALTMANFRNHVVGE